MLSKRFQFFLVLLLCLITAGIYARSAFFPFNLLDDAAYVTNNVHVMQGLSLDTIKWAFTSVYQYNWIPLTWLSFALEARFFGADPMGYHIVNVVLHVVNVWLLYYLLKSMTGEFWKSLLVAALFALHPLRVESVAWITERKDVLSTLFWLLTLICYVLYTQKRHILMYILSIGAFSLGLLSKQMLVTVPAVLLLMDFWPLKRFAIPSATSVTDDSSFICKQTTIKKLLIEKVPFLLVAVAASAITFYATYTTKAIKSAELLPLSQRIINSLWYFLVYLYKTILPLDLAIVYPIVEEPFWKALCSAVLIGTALYGAFRKRHTIPYLAIGLLFYFITVFPVIGLIQVGAAALADRFVYVPLIGIFVIFSWGAEDIVNKWPHLRHAVLAITGLALGCCAAMTCVQLAYWKNNTTLFRHAVDVTKENHVAHEMLGVAYAEEGKLDLALGQFDKAQKIGPECPELHLAFGNLLDRMGRPGEAAGHYEVVTRLNPTRVSGHLAYARMLQKQGRIMEAISAYDLAIRIEPRNALLHDGLGLAYLQSGQLDEAINHLSTALNLDPSSGQINANLQFAKSLNYTKK